MGWMTMRYIYLTLFGFFLILGGLGCADTEYQGSDGGVDLKTEASATDQFFWPDQEPTADIGDFPFPAEMYAHSQSELFSIDPQTLELTQVGAFGPEEVDINDLAVTPDGKLYAISVNDLYQVDHQTAELSWITQIEGTANVALTFEPAGTLLASDKAGALRRIDPVTGEVSEIGTYGTGLGSSGDLVAIQDGTLYGVNDVGEGKKDNNDLLVVDPESGAAQIVGPIGFDHVWGLAYWGGTIYGLTQSGQLIGIDPQTGAGELISSFAYEFWGAAVTPMAPID